MSAPFAAVVSGIGLVTPAGIGTAENWESVVSGRSAAAVDPSLDALPVHVVCRADDGFLDLQGMENAWQWDRFTQFAVAATLLALEDAGLEPHAFSDDTRVAVIIGSGAGGTGTLETQHAALLEEGPTGLSPLTLPMGLLNMAAGQVAIQIGAHGPCIAPCTACAAAASAIGIARDILRSGAADIVVAGGAEAAITPLYVSAFARMRALSRTEDPARASRPFSADRDGFVLGEGAGVFVLETEEHARRRGARSRARILGYGASADAFHVTRPHREGRGARLAMNAALADARLDPSEIGYVNAHGTSTPGNDVVECAAIRSIFGPEIAVGSTKGVTGHLLGAAGAIEAAYCMLAIEHGVLPPTANLVDADPAIDVDLIATAREQKITAALSNSFGFGGQNATLVIAQ